jgi:hypothetical protein
MSTLNPSHPAHRRIRRAAVVATLAAALITPVLGATQASAASTATTAAATPTPTPYQPRAGSWQQWVLDHQPRASTNPIEPEPRLRHIQPDAASVQITSDYTRLQVPTRLRAGRTTFDVRALTYGFIELARPVPGYTPQQFVQDLGAEGSRAARARVKYSARLAGGDAALTGIPGQFTTTLYPGRYWVYDYMLARLLGPSQIHSITVTGRAPRPQFPRVSGIVRLAPNLIPRTTRSIRGQGDFLIANDSDQVSSLIVAGLRPGRTLQDFRWWVRRGQPDPSPLDESRMAVSARVGPNTSFIWHLNVPRGRYLVSSFDADDERQVRTIWLR